MYKELNRYDTFEDAILAIYGRTLDQLSDEFQLAMRRDFYPSVDSLAPLPCWPRRSPSSPSSPHSCPTPARPDGDRVVPARWSTSRRPPGTSRSIASGWTGESLRRS